MAPLDRLPLLDIEQYFTALSKPMVTKAGIAQLEEIERQQAELLNLEEFKFNSNQEMLDAVGLLAPPLPGNASSLG